jgi:hypothetical protein
MNLPPRLLHDAGFIELRTLLRSEPVRIDIARAGFAASGGRKQVSRSDLHHLGEPFLSSPKARAALSNPAGWPASEACQALGEWLEAQGQGRRSTTALGRILGATPLLHRLATKTGRVYAPTEGLLALWQNRAPAPSMTDLTLREVRLDEPIACSDEPADMLLTCSVPGEVFSVAVRLEVNMTQLGRAYDWFDRLMGPSGARARKGVVGSRRLLGCLVSGFPLNARPKADFRRLGVGTFFVDVPDEEEQPVTPWDAADDDEGDV